MATTLKTTFLLKRGTLANWESKNPVLQKGEPGFVEDKNILKIGDGVHAYKDLKPLVPEWAQQDTKPEYTAEEISGLQEYINGELEDTDTQYKIVKVDENNYKLQSKGKNDAVWTDVTDSVIAIPTYDDTDVKKDISNIKEAVGLLENGTEGVETIPDKIDNAIQESKDYTDNQIKDNLILNKEATPNAGYTATYKLKYGDKSLGEVNIPKDYLVKSGDIKTVTSANTPYDGATVGERYIDFVVNTIDDDGTEKHMYIPLKDIAGATYFDGNGIEIADDNKINIKLQSGAENGLAVDSNGLRLDLATAEANGAMSKEAFADLANLKSNHTKVEASETNGYIKINGNETKVYELPDDVIRADDSFIFDGGEA